MTAILTLTGTLYLAAQKVKNKIGSSGISGKDLFDERLDRHIDPWNDSGSPAMGETSENTVVREPLLQAGSPLVLGTGFVTPRGAVVYENAILPRNT